MEDSVGFGNGAQNFESLWFNHFSVIPGQTSITTVSVAWGTPNFSDPINGTPVTIAVWSDPNGDGNPSDAVLLGSVAGTIQNAGTDTFVDYTFNPPIDVSAYNGFFVGDKTPMNNGPEHFFQGIDENSTLHRQSWVAAMSSGGPVNINNPGLNDFIGLIDDFGLPGNWGIRADTGNPTPTPTPTPSSTPTPTPAGALWYNGDFNDVNGLANERDTSLGSGQYASVYDDFNVTDSQGWDVHSVFSNNLSSTIVTGATWEIRQGVSAGNPGTLIASGSTATPIVTATGRGGFGFTEFMVEVTGLNVFLPAGSYHLNVTPTGNLTGRSFDSTTSGANCIGTPCGNNQNAFFDSNFFGAFFASTADFGQPYDFSMGVNGDVHGGGGGLTLVSAASRKHHGNAGDFDINLPLDGSGIEPRLGNGNTLESVVFTFSGAVDSVGGASTSCGQVVSTTVDGSNVTVLIRNFTCNASDVTVSLTGVNGDSSASISFGVLFGDVNQDGTVNRSDLQQVQMAIGRGLVNDGNFIDDVTVDGKVNRADTQTVKANNGNSLP